MPASAEETAAPREEDKSVPESETIAEPAESAVLPKSGVSYRVALGGVIFLGVLIIIGIAVLVIGLIKGWNRPKPVPADPMADFHKPMDMALHPGYRILSSDTQPGRLILHIRSDTSDEIWIIDINNGRIVAVIHGEAPKQ